MFTMKGSISKQGMQEDDLVTVTQALRALGHYDHEDKNLDPVADDDFFGGIAAFQARHGLPATGHMSRMDPTHRKMKDSLRRDVTASARFHANRSAYDDHTDAVEWGEAGD